MRILDLDSMHPSDVQDSNYFILANTRDRYGVSRITVENVRQYIIADYAIDVVTAQNLIDNSIDIFDNGLTDSFMPRTEFDFTIDAGTNLVIGGDSSFTDSNRTITINHGPKDPNLVNASTDSNYFVSGLTFDNQGHVIGYDRLDFSTVLSDDIAFFIDSDYLARLIDSSTDTYINYVAGAFGGVNPNTLTGLNLVNELLLDPQIQKQYAAAAIGNIVARFADSDYVMSRHTDKAPTLVNALEQAGTYVAGLTFDDKGHVVEQSTLDISDYVDATYIDNNLPTVTVTNSTAGNGPYFLNDATIDTKGRVTATEYTDITSYIDSSFVMARHREVATSQFTGGSGAMINSIKTDTFGHLDSVGYFDLNDVYVSNITVNASRTYDALRLRDSTGAIGMSKTFSVTSNGNVEVNIEHIHRAALTTDATETLPDSGTMFDTVEFDRSGHVKSISGTSGNLDNRIQHIVDATYITNRIEDTFLDSIEAGVLITNAIDALIDGAPGTLNTLNEIAAALNDDDSAYATLVNMINTNLDSAEVRGIIDSAYINLRVDPAVDSAEVIKLIDSAYINLRVDPAVDSDEVMKIIDSAYINDRVEAGIDSSAISSMIDSAYIQARQVDIFRDSSYISTVYRDYLFTDSLQATNALIDSNLTVGGNITAGGDITATGNVTAFSDARLKDNVESITDAIAKVQQVRGVTFDRIWDGARGTGVIAQELQNVLPEAVVETDDGYLHVAYGNIVGLLIEAVKELKSEIEELKKK